MNDIQKIKEFFSKSLEEATFKVGDKITYLGHPGVITGVNKEMTGDITYNVSYDKGTGKTKATNLSNKGGEIKMAEAMDYNDPVLMKARAAAFQRSQPKPEPSKAFKNADKIKTLERERVQLMRDMEQEAEPEGGPIADRYGALLDKIDKAIAKLKGQDSMMEEAMTTAYEGKDSSIEDIKVGDVLNLKDGETWKVIKLTSNGGVLAAPFGKTRDSYISIAIEFPAHILKNEVVSLNEAKSEDKVMNEANSLEKNLIKNITKYLKKRNPTFPEDIIIKKVSSWLNQGKNLMTATNAMGDNFKKDVLNPIESSLTEAKSEDKVDTITMDIPLFLRMLEYSREDASQDVDLHAVTEKANKLGKERGILSIEDYDEIVGAAEEVDEASDYFKRRKAMDDYAVSKQDKPKKPYNPNPSGKTDYMKRREAEKGLEEKINEALNKINEELCPAGKAYIKRRKAAGEKSSAYLSGRAVKVCKGQMSGKSKKTNESIINEGQKINQNLDNLLNKIKKDFNIE